MKFTKAILIFLTIFALGCEKGAKTKERPLVLASIAPYAYIAEKIAGDTIEIKVLAPPGTNPHVYEPTFKSMDRLEKTVVWIQIGELFEKRVFQILKKLNPDISALNMMSSITEHHCGQCGALDRHIWLAPSLLQKQARTIANLFKEKFPYNAPLYEDNLKNFLNELSVLNDRLSILFASRKEKAILVSHPSLGYFCKDFGITQLSVEKEGGDDPSGKEIEKLMRLSKELDIRSAFTSPQHNNKGAELIAEKLNMKINSIDPYDYDLFKNLEIIAWEISRGAKEDACQALSK